MKVTDLTLSAGGKHIIAQAFKGSLRGLFFDMEVMTRLFLRLPADEPALDDKFGANEKETGLTSVPKTIEFILSDGSSRRFQPTGISRGLHFYLTVLLDKASQVVVEMADTPRARELLEQFKIDCALGQNLEDCCFYRRGYNLIRRHHPNWVECHDLCAATEAEMLVIPGFGPAALRDLKIDLAEMGLTLGMGKRVVEYRSRRFA